MAKERLPWLSAGVKGVTALHGRGGSDPEFNLQPVLDAGPRVANPARGVALSGSVQGAQLCSASLGGTCPSSYGQPLAFVCC